MKLERLLLLFELEPEPAKQNRYADFKICRHIIRYPYTVMIMNTRCLGPPTCWSVSESEPAPSCQSSSESLQLNPSRSAIRLPALAPPSRPPPPPPGEPLAKKVGLPTRKFLEAMPVPQSWLDSPQPCRVEEKIFSTTVMEGTVTFHVSFAEA